METVTIQNLSGSCLGKSEHDEFVDSDFRIYHHDSSEMECNLA